VVEFSSRFKRIAQGRVFMMPVVARVGTVDIEVRYGSSPPPHFWASDGSNQASIMIATLTVIKNTLPVAVLNQVITWASKTGHQAGLSREWVKALSHLPLGTVP
jgi:hypothetical protein